MVTLRLMKFNDIFTNACQKSISTFTNNKPLQLPNCVRGTNSGTPKTFENNF